mmetsp:Transcript_12353/g.35314  ORF Transcript_12353/g.35314 Transcript_12353/m.35314 type:complete len:227 (+) Transcript_12353:792-1472(+)
MASMIATSERWASRSAPPPRPSWPRGRRKNFADGVDAAWAVRPAFTVPLLKSSKTRTTMPVLLVVGCSPAASMRKSRTSTNSSTTTWTMRSATRTRRRSTSRPSTFPSASGLPRIAPVGRCRVSFATSWPNTPRTTGMTTEMVAEVEEAVTQTEEGKMANHPTAAAVARLRPSTSSASVPCARPTARRSRYRTFISWQRNPSLPFGSPTLRGICWIFLTRPPLATL